MKNRPTNLLDRKVSLFTNVKTTSNPETLPLLEVLTRIKSGRYRETVESLRTLSKEEYGRKKPHTPAFTISAYCNHRQAKTTTEDKLIYHTGLIQVDVDGVESDQIEPIKEQLIKDPHTAFCFTSLSGKGIKAAIRTENDHADQERAFRYMASYCKEQHGITIDEAPKDLFRLCFVSYDPDLFINPDPETLLIPEPKKEDQPSKPRPRQSSPLAFDDLQAKKQKIIDNANKILDQSSPGNRHSFRLKAGLLLGGYIAGGVVTEYEALSGIDSTLRANTDHYSQAVKDIKDAISAGRAKPLYPDEVFTRKRSITKPTPEKQTQRTAKQRDPVIISPYAHDWTEIGNTDRFLEGKDDKLVFYGDKFFCWDGIRWQPDETDRVLKKIEIMAKAMYRTAKRGKDVDFLKWAKQSTSNRSMKAIHEIASRRQKTTDIFDKDRLKLACHNAVIDLRSGQEIEAKKDFYITKQANVLYDPQATCPNWDSFLTTIFEGNNDLVEFVQRSVGLSATGLTRRALFICYGRGNNGKSVFLHTISKILHDFAIAVKPETLLLSNDSRTFDLAQLQGKRFVTCSESERGVRLAEARVKQITGGDTINAEAKYKDPINFDPEFTVWMSSNYKPHVKGTDQGIWDRIKLIPFEYQFTKSTSLTRDQVDSMFDKERSGIFNWILAGVKAFMEIDLSDPEAITTAVTDYRSEADTIGQFIADCCEVDPQGKVSRSDLYQDFKEWAEANGEYVQSQRKFSQQIKERSGISELKIHGERYWTGIKRENENVIL